MIKASAGGGGKGLRVAFNDKECFEGFTSCRNEAKNAFGDDRVFIEKFVEEPRHIEIQVLGDSHGNIVYLNERECSIQRRHQKVIEEAPSPFLDDQTRRAMGEQAVQLARAVQYQSAGTVEFVVGKDKSFYFLEMNTRLQVEHPVTEFITGIDLVELMIRVAAGERLPLTQQEVKREGWAMECRINAEDPLRNFLPSSGRLVKFMPPPETAGQVRVDTGVYEGGEVSMYYDSMIAKLICHGKDREEARKRLAAALDAFVVKGPGSNINFVSAVARHPRFASGDFNTGFIAEQFPKGFHSTDLIHDEPLLLAAVAALARRRYIARAVQTTGTLRGHRRQVGNDWVVLMAGKRYALRLTPKEGGARIDFDGKTHELLSDWKLGDLIFRGSWDSEDICLQIQRVGWRYRLIHWGTQADIEVLTARSAHLLSLMPEKPKPDLSRFVLSPMPGLLTEITVKPGQEVKAGEKIAVIEAMKMENVLRAESDAVVKEVRAKKGDSLAVDQAIIEFQ
jgi:propionyl-CoA carboxylase alpha chain